jgi:translation initiation factor 1
MGLFAGTQWDLPAHCDHCGKLESDCDCPPPRPEVKSPSSQTLRVRVEKRKAGRVVTVVAGLETDSAGRAELLTRLKNVCGCGGSQQDTNLVIQGDQAARIKPLLSVLGYRVK